MDEPMPALSSVSDAELKRRWDAVRAGMRERGIDYLVMQNSEEHMGGILRWFTDYSAWRAFPMTVIFPIEGDPTVITCEAPPSSSQVPPPPWSARGIEHRLAEVNLPILPYTVTYDARLAAQVLNAKPKATIAWGQPSLTSLAFADYLREHVTGMTWVDATEWLDRIKLVKSDEEVELVRAAAAIQDACIAHLAEFIRPGVPDHQVWAEAHSFLQESGSGPGLVQVSTGPISTMPPFDGPLFHNRVIENGHQVVVHLEGKGPNGYYCEIMRVFTVGADPSPELIEAFDIACQTEELMCSLMKPGASTPDVFAAAKDFLVGKGCVVPMRSFGHGQGLTLVERPNFRPDETLLVEPGLNVALHPMAIKVPTWSIVCDNFIIRVEGTEQLHRFPREITRI